jgi:hypothetical protein
MEIAVFSAVEQSVSDPAQARGRLSTPWQKRSRTQLPLSASMNTAPRLA